MTRPKINIVVDGRAIEAEAGRPLLSVVMSAGLVIATACSGRGSCHLCRVTVTGGGDELPPPTSVERRSLGNVLLAQGMRLACQIAVEHPMSVSLPRVETSSERQARLEAAQARRDQENK